MEDIYRVIGKRIRQIRLKLDLTQEQLAELADLSVTYVSQIERGHNKASLATIQKVASALHVNVADLFSGEVVQHLPSNTFSRRLQILISKCPPQSRLYLEEIIKTFLKAVKKS